MQPLISVIIPVYKVEAYLTACVESVLAQTYKNIEVLLVDDGSPDNCPRMCDEFAARDSRIRVIHKENGGLSSARNAGIDAARGQYLAFLDSDDLWTPLFLERLYRAIGETDADFSVCLFRRFREEPPKELPEPVQTEALSRREAFECLFNARNENMVVAWNKLYRRELFETVRYPDGRIHEDEAIIHELIGVSDRIAWLDEVHHLYRTSPNSITTSRFSPKRLDAVWAKEQRITWFEARGMQELADRTRIACMQLLMYLHREAQADRADPAKSAELCRQIHGRFRTYWDPELIRSCPTKTQLRFALFRILPHLISGIYRIRLK